MNLNKLKINNLEIYQKSEVTGQISFQVTWQIHGQLGLTFLLDFFCPSWPGVPIGCRRDAPGLATDGERYVLEWPEPHPPYTAASAQSRRPSFFGSTFNIRWEVPGSHFSGYKTPNASVCLIKNLELVNTCACSVAQSSLTLCDPMDCSPPGSSVPGILQARILPMC